MTLHDHIDTKALHRGQDKGVVFVLATDTKGRPIIAYRQEYADWDAKRAAMRIAQGIMDVAARAAQ